MKYFLKKYWWTILLGGIVTVAIIKRKVIMDWYKPCPEGQEKGKDGKCVANCTGDMVRNKETGVCEKPKSKFVGTNLTGNLMYQN